MTCKEARLPTAFVGAAVPHIVQHSSLPRPFYEDAAVTLYHGDAMGLLPLMPSVDAIVTDPPYGETSLAWDKWPEGWPDVAALVAPQIWCFGSMRMFMAKGDQFQSSGWKLAQDIIWEKHNGSGSANDRFRRLHELALHFYRGSWADVFKEPQVTNDATARTLRRKARPAHWGDIGAASYASEDGGPKLMGSVIYARSCHGYAVNETQKPEAIVAPLIRYSVPPGGVLIDPFAGSGTMGVVARKTGRKAILIESRETQCQAIAARLAQGDMLTSHA
ncbi:site-specific DNA-methyltransferase [Hydrogenophaga aromaticivorans]|uniref:DNA-methyltransferase n=1 Tax=Hydrogenophaga aromaticivorans TaxID=2610898 RepID=UPI001B370D57|nr:DNA methyltransferase [Hydrogenophaga aromaticivorans]MBQ0916971.1 site-specific DNA-methyltransferase [Hydrogenophaga aromaticivorans]